MQTEFQGAKQQHTSVHNALSTV